MDEPLEKYKYIEKLDLNPTKEESKSFSKIHCPSCNGVVAADSINLQNNISKCNTCNVIFSIEKEVDDVKSENKVKQELLRPEGIELFHFNDELDITIQQHIQGFDAFAVMTFPLIAMFAILLTVLGKPVPYILTASFSILASYYIYKAFNYSKNKVHIDINSRSLNIKYRPKNFNKDKSFAIENIDQVYIRMSPSGSGYYQLTMIINGINGQKHEKLMIVNSLSKAKYLEQELERYLKIKDRKVPEAVY